MNFRSHLMSARVGLKPVVTVNLGKLSVAKNRLNHSYSKHYNKSCYKSSNLNFRCRLMLAGDGTKTIETANAKNLAYVLELRSCLL